MTPPSPLRDLLFLLFFERLQAASLPSSCSRSCAAFERCFVYDNAEFCAPLCAPGRCDDDRETCILRGVVPCTSSPCLPEAICEPRTHTLVSTTPSSSACDLHCPLVSSPVCGSDDVSYANSCFLEQARCTSSSPDLMVASRGLCERERDLNAAFNPPSSPSSSSSNDVCVAAVTCSEVLDPVCTTDGTRRNLCYFRREQRCSSTSTLQLLHPGACEAASNVQPLCPAACTQVYAPICASNGQVYGNECLFRQAKCLRRDLLAVNIEARALSECEQHL